MPGGLGGPPTSLPPALWHLKCKQGSVRTGAGSRGRSVSPGRAPSLPYAHTSSVPAASCHHYPVIVQGQASVFSPGRVGVDPSLFLSHACEQPGYPE